MGTVFVRTPTRHRYDVRDYYRMAEAGILSPDARIELIEGELVDMAPIGSRHAAVVDRFARSLTLAVGERAIVRVQGPVRLNELSEPQPDIALLRPREDFYAAAHPGPADVLLLIEVADSSLEYDRGVKLPLYARHGIPECWLVNLERGVINRCREPSDDGYRRAEPIVGLVELPGLPGCAVALLEITSAG